MYLTKPCRQEVCRRHRSDHWEISDVVLKIQVTDFKPIDVKAVAEQSLKGGDNRQDRSRPPPDSDLANRKKILAASRDTSDKVPKKKIFVRA